MRYCVPLALLLILGMSPVRAEPHVLASATGAAWPVVYPRQAASFGIAGRPALVRQAVEPGGDHRTELSLDVLRRGVLLVHLGDLRLRLR